MVEHITHQGEQQGEMELRARILVIETSPYRRFGAWASTVRKHARVAWTERGIKRTHYTLVVKGH
jgi:hypothetical protein